MGSTTRASRRFLNLESLETRNLFAVSMGSDGFTDVDPSADTRVIYVSSSAGNDANAGLSASAPVKTLAKARSLLRDGSPDWMLLKRRDAWTENLTNWTHSGRNQQEPMVIGAYGTGERPLLKTGTSGGFKNSDQVSHLAIMGIHFHAHTRDTSSSSYNGTTAGSYGFHSMGRLDDVLVEDAVFDDYTYNLSVTGYDSTITDFRLRRSIVTDAWSTDGKSQGMYVSKTNRILLEENVFDHNGWNEDVLAAKANIYSHGIYMSSGNDNVIVRGNVIADSASHGLQARAGGVIENNLFLRNPINLMFGASVDAKPGGVSGRVTGNVFLDSRDISGSNRGTAIEIGNIKPGANVVVSNNIMTADTHRKMSAISFYPPSAINNPQDAVGINDLTFRDNIVYDWHAAWTMSDQFKLGVSGAYGVNNLRVVDNDFQFGNQARLVRQGTGNSTSEITWSGNRYTNHSWFSPSGWFLIGSTTTSFNTWKANVESTARSTVVAYADPLRSIGTYQASIGQSASLSAFLTEARDQAKGSYDGRFSAAAVINHVRQGFAEGGVVPGGLLSTGEAAPAGDTTAPTAPSTLLATGASDTTVDLAWTASSDDVGVAGYEIFRSGVKVATVTGTKYTDTGLEPSTAYVYTVRAFDAAGNFSTWSNNDTGTTLAATTPTPTPTPAPTVPAAPTNLTAVKVQRKARLTWSDGAVDETGFYVYSSTDGVSWTRYATIAANAGTGLVEDMTSPLKDTRYFRVTAFNDAGESASSNVVEVTN